MVRHGIGYVPEGRHVFPGLPVEKNLLLGAYARRWNAARRADLDEVYELFPVLARDARTGWPARCRADSSRCSPSGGR